jgi:hypothetical protein
MPQHLGELLLDVLANSLLLMNRNVYYIQILRVVRPGSATSSKELHPPLERCLTYAAEVSYSM